MSRIKGWKKSFDTGRAADGDRLIGWERESDGAAVTISQNDWYGGTWFMLSTPSSRTRFDMLTMAVDEATRYMRSNPNG
jgi:hypothetical protein